MRKTSDLNPRLCITREREGFALASASGCALMVQIGAMATERVYPSPHHHALHHVPPHVYLATLDAQTAAGTHTCCTNDTHLGSRLNMCATCSHVRLHATKRVAGILHNTSSTLDLGALPNTHMAALLDVEGARGLKAISVAL